MRIAIGAVLGFILVAVMELGAWLLSGLMIAIGMLVAAIPAGAGAVRVLPAVLGLVFLWRAFKLMERPVLPKTMFQATTAFAHHQKELRASAAAAALLMTTVLLSQLAPVSAVPVPTWLQAVDMATKVSVFFAVLVLSFACVRVRKASWFRQEHPVFH